MPLEYPSNEFIEYTYFRGCVRKLTENLQMYDFNYPVKVVRAPIGCTIMAPCPDCKNGGYCSPGFARSVCTCTMGYVGDDCTGRKQSSSLARDQIITPNVKFRHTAKNAHDLDQAWRRIMLDHGFS